MPCGVTKQVAPGFIATCDNSGTSAHTGLHTATMTMSVGGRVWASIPVRWAGSDSVPHRVKALTVGDGAL